MTRQVWPFKPLSPVLDVQQWFTDVFQAKAAEQRIALRDRPLRVFQYQHQVGDTDLANAQALIRANQGGDGFYVPDWTQAERVGALAAGSDVPFPGDTTGRQYGDDALVWGSVQQFERVTLTDDSAGLVIDQVVGTYADAYVMPLWNGDAPEPAEAERLGARQNILSIAFVLDGANAFGSSTFDQYLGLDVVPDCPVLAGGLSDTYGFDLTQFGTGVGNQEYLRRRDLANIVFSLRWQKFTAADQAELRDWIATRYGRQKAFWVSSSAQDLEPAAGISGTTVTVYNDILARGSGYHLEILGRDGTKYLREATAVAAGTDVGGRATVDITIDSSVTVDLADIVRVSYLYCARFDADRIEYSFEAPNRLTVAVPCREVPQP